MALGATKLISVDWVKEVMTALTARCAPGALGAKTQDAIQFIRRLKAAESIDTYLAQFDLLRKVAENGMGRRMYPPGSVHYPSTYSWGFSDA